ncbi:hypothetical protein [Pedobacter sp. JCM 36344]|uniref:hypothetical protein n=1 Tax=Pedobacter sp. JCM 36344 TaxID=3374280 RepID=UPI0039786B9E
MKPAFKTLYYLENGSLSILEIKRTDLSEDADISDVYKWLQVDKFSFQVSLLSFRSMDSSDNVEERFFDQGYLKINKDEGTFIEKFNSGLHNLKNQSNREIPSEVQVAVEAFLN